MNGPTLVYRITYHNEPQPDGAPTVAKFWTPPVKGQTIDVPVRRKRHTFGTIARMDVVDIIPRAYLVTDEGDCEYAGDLVLLET